MARRLQLKMHLGAQNQGGCVVQWLRTQTWNWTSCFPVPALAFSVCPWTIYLAYLVLNLSIGRMRTTMIMIPISEIGWVNTQKLIKPDSLSAFKNVSYYINNFITFFLSLKCFILHFTSFSIYPQFHSEIWRIYNSDEKALASETNRHGFGIGIPYSCGLGENM